MPKCEITGKHRQTGNHVSHANNKNKTVFGANIQKISVLDENGTRRRAWVSTRAIKSNAIVKSAPRRVLLEIARRDAENS